MKKEQIPCRGKMEKIKRCYGLPKSMGTSSQKLAMYIHISGALRILSIRKSLVRAQTLAHGAPTSS